MNNKKIILKKEKNYLKYVDWLGELQCINPVDLEGRLKEQPKFFMASKSYQDNSHGMSYIEQGKFKYGENFSELQHMAEVYKAYEKCHKDLEISFLSGHLSRYKNSDYNMLMEEFNRCGEELKKHGMCWSDLIGDN